MATFSNIIPAGIPAAARRDLGGSAAFLAAAGMAEAVGDARSVPPALFAAAVCGGGAAWSMWRARRVSAAQRRSEVT